MNARPTRFAGHVAVVVISAAIAIGWAGLILVQSHDLPFLQSGYTIERGAQLNYDQWYVSLGYRFDARGPSSAFGR